MEFSFVINALRRYLWVPILCAVLGAVAGFVLDSRGGDMYSSESILLVTPPSESSVQVSFNNDPDRYAIGQLTVLQSAGLAERVAAKVGRGQTAGSVLASVMITHEPKTDIFHIVARTDSGALSQAVANEYVDLYFQSIRTAVDEAQQPAVEQINQQLASLTEQIAAIDAQVVQVMKPYLSTDGSSTRPIPGLEQVAPDLVTRKQTLLGEYDQLLQSKAQFEISQRLRVTSQVIQSGLLPSAPDTKSSSLLYLGLFGGLFGGMLLAVLIGRLSPVIVDSAQAAEVLGHPITGRFPHVRALAKTRVAGIHELPAAAIAVVDAICVRAETAAQPGDPLVVVVVGSERSAGTTTLAIAMANRFAVAGSQVLLVDADVRHPAITRVFARGRPGIAALAGLASSDTTVPRAQTGSIDPVAPTSVPGLSVVGLGTKSDTVPLRRQNVLDVVTAAKAHSPVVVFDGGPLLDSATTVHLAQLADAVVLAVPLARQRVDELTSVTRQTSLLEGEVLVVDMPASPPRVRRSNERRGAPPSPAKVVRTATSAPLDPPVPVKTGGPQ